MDNVFTSTYDNYLIKFACSATAQNSLYFRLRSGGSDTTTNYQGQQLIISNTTVSAARNTDGEFGAVNSTGVNFTDIQVLGPNKASYTGLFTFSIREDSSNINQYNYGHFQKSTTQFDGIKIYPGSGTITGTISIYGLAK